VRVVERREGDFVAGLGVMGTLQSGVEQPFVRQSTINVTRVWEGIHFNFYATIYNTVNWLAKLDVMWVGCYSEGLLSTVTEIVCCATRRQVGCKGVDGVVVSRHCSR